LTGFASAWLADLAQAFAVEGDFERSRAMLTTLLAAAGEVGFLRGASEALTALALVEWHAGASLQAGEYARQGVEAAARAEHREASVYCHAVLGLVAGRDRRDEARGWLTRALRDARVLPFASRAIAFILEAFAATADPEDAADAARLLGAASIFRQAPGSAAGSPFAAITLGPVASTAAAV